jgi:hypothetical protein
MSMRKLIVGPIAAAVMLFGGAGTAAAATLQYDFGTLLTPSGAIQPSATFATLSVSTTDNLQFTFDLRANNLNAIFGTGAFISTMYVNTLSGDDANSVAINPGPAGYTLEKGVQNVVMDTTPSNLGGVNWDFSLSFCGTQNSNPCSQSNADLRRLQANEQVIWSAVFADAQVDPFFGGSPIFGLKVQGITIGPEGSATYTPPIPEPEIYAMLAAGLGLMGFVARRKRQAAAAREVS